MRILVVTQHFWPENFRINDIVEGFVQDGLSVDVLCGLPNYPKGEWFDGYSADGPFEEVYKGARVFRAREIPRKGNTGKTIFLNYVSWPLYAAGALKRLPGGYDAVFCFNTSPVLMCWPAIRYAKKHHIPFTNYVLDLWPENLYSVLPVKNRFMRWVAQSVSDSLYRRCDRLIAMSGPLQERLCARTGKSTADVAVIPQYCEDFYAVPQHDAALEAQFAGRFNVVFTGTFTPAQSLDMVIRAVLDARAAGAEALRLTQFSIDQSTVGILWVNWDSHVRYANRAAESMLGYGPGALIERPLAALDPTLDMDRWLNLWKRARASEDGAQSFETHCVRADGSILPTDVSLSFLRFRDSEYLVVYLNDITERHQVQAALQESDARLQGIAANVPGLVFRLERSLLTGELDAQHQHCITIQHEGFTCEADTLGSHGYVYVALYSALTL